MLVFAVRDPFLSRFIQSLNPYSLRSFLLSFHSDLLLRALPRLYFFLLFPFRLLFRPRFLARLLHLHFLNNFFLHPKHLSPICLHGFDTRAVLCMLPQGLRPCEGQVNIESLCKHGGHRPPQSKDFTVNLKIMPDLVISR